MNNVIKSWGSGSHTKYHKRSQGGGGMSPNDQRGSQSQGGDREGEQKAKLKGVIKIAHTKRNIFWRVV